MHAATRLLTLSALQFPSRTPPINCLETTSASTSASTAPLPPDEAAFLSLVTVDSIDAAAATYARYGIVRVPAFLDAAESTALYQAADDCGLRRDAFGQSSQDDRYTLWLAGDGMEGVAGAATATATVEDAAPCARRAFLDEDGWRSIAATRGYGHLALAEVVTSMPGGSEQRWHFDGEGVTAQIALVPIGDAQGPTEVTPRPMASEFVDNSEFVSGISAALQDGSGSFDADSALSALQRLPKLALAAPQRPLYDVITGLHAAAWSALRPALNALATVDESASERLARQLIEGGLTPPVVHLTADVGCLTLYDSAMVHRGGRNTGATARPILAVHLRAGSEYGPGEDTPGVQR